MAEPAICVQDLSKLYHIADLHRGRTTFREALIAAFAAPVRRAGNVLRGRPVGAAQLDKEFWALRNVSFKVEQGEIVGIIGRNGAGKSTLLKILSRITEPTTGYCEMRGRVGSLLEVGTGFHTELTGRENVYLNGAILGMTRAEINRKFDEIVAFSEIEEFLDTPIKHYSSGMKMRLAFAVAAHLEPEILIIDEVLAVGDAAFQRKCLNKMQDIGKEGRTVLFVSHNMSAVTRLCGRGILLDSGGVIDDGPADKVVSSYLNVGYGTSAFREWNDPATAPGGEVARLRAVRVINGNGQIAEAVSIKEDVGLQMEFEVIKGGYTLLPHFYLYNEEGVCVFGALDQDPAWRRQPRPEGRYVSTAWIPGNLLAEGTLFVNCNLITLSPNILQFKVTQAVAIHVVDSSEGDTARGDWSGRMHGVVRPMLKWTTEFGPTAAATRAAGSGRDANRNK